MSRADRILIAVLVLALVIAWPVASALAGQGTGRAIVTGPSGTTVIDLGRDAEYEVAGSVGGATVQVRDGAIAVTDSTCPDRVCVHAGWVRSPGSVIACVPNRITVRIEGRGRERLDTVVR